MTTDNSFSVAILAGGNSERFGGKTKPLLTIGGMPIIEIIIDSLYDVSNDITVVTDKVDICRTLQGDGNKKVVRCMEDLIPKRGPLSGIHAALVSAKNDPVFVCGADMPFVKPYLVEKLYESYVKGFANSRSLAVIPRYGEREIFIEPLFAFYSKELIGHIEDYIKGSRVLSLHYFLEGIDCNFYDVSNEEIEIFTNINTPEDYLKVLKNCKMVLQ